MCNLFSFCSEETLSEFSVYHSFACFHSFHSFTTCLYNQKCFILVCFECSIDTFVVCVFPCRCPGEAGIYIVYWTNLEYLIRFPTFHSILFHSYRSVKTKARFSLLCLVAIVKVKMARCLPVSSFLI